MSFSLLIAGSCSSKPKRIRLTRPICTTAHKSRPDSLQTVFALCFSSKTLRNRPEAQGLQFHEKFVIHNESAHTQFSRTLNLNPSFAIFNDDFVMSI